MGLIAAAGASIDAWPALRERAVAFAGATHALIGFSAIACRVWYFDHIVIA
jgi:hypothetical protein